MESQTTSAPHQDAPINVGTQGLERVYAKAIFAAARAQVIEITVTEDLEAIVSELLQTNPQFAELLASVRIKPEEKEALLDRVLGGQIAPLLLSSLKVLARHERLGLLSGIARELRSMLTRSQGLVQVEVTSAVPLEGNELEKIRNRLRSGLQIEPVLVTKVRPDLLGGLLIRIQDSVFDGTLASQLGRLRQQMDQGSVHEIQSGRDRFSSAEGN